MTVLAEHFRLDCRGAANPAALVHGRHARFTALTSRLLRLEYSASDEFEDRPSQAFWYREQPAPALRVVDQPDSLEIITEHLHLRYDPRADGFSADSLAITLLETGHTWRYGDPNPENLGGTARTLDGADGPVPLDPGLLSRAGWAVVNDSHSLLLNDDGWIDERRGAGADLYFFGYGHDYLGCLADFCRIAGRVPLLPRWSLGNWWSRYWAYRQDELQQLVEEFRAKSAPLSGCIIDMDWHIVQTGNRSRGWTGYTWNRELWPAPRQFIAWLHGQGLRTALNLHPADGVHPHEEMYPQMCQAMGIDPASGEPVRFDCGDPAYIKAYFDLLHHPQEEAGVDFWWLDWQQGTFSKVAGLDPLWWLNHLHWYDLARNGDKRPFIFSRWGGLGNHRYQIGFSGDSSVTWDSLAFQPYFTATASNVAYSWWSHDIGGHQRGIEEPELYARWVQWGVFSPILRLHSTNNPYHDRRPWAHGDDVWRVARQALQLRHALIPYLYTMSWRNHTADMPLLQPMYYRHAELDEAYHCPNQYYFGSELVVAPYTRPADPDTRLSRQVVWLPKGRWFDFFSGQEYAGDAWHAVYGALDDIPVFARAGAIMPLGPMTGWDNIAVPDSLRVHVFPGADNRFVLYEDDGVSLDYRSGRFSTTVFRVAQRGSRLTFEIAPAAGSTAHLPARRSYDVLFRCAAEPGDLVVEINGARQQASLSYHAQTRTAAVAGISLAPSDSLRIRLALRREEPAVERARLNERLRAMLRAFRLESDTKRYIDEHLAEVVDDVTALQPCLVNLQPAHVRALVETLTGCGAEMVDTTGADRFVVLWSNGRENGLRYTLSAAKRGRRFSAAGGRVPRYLALPFGAGEGRQRLSVDYAGLTTLTWEHA